MKNKLKLALGMFALVTLSSCGDSDMENGAVAHGKNMGEKKCECANAAPEDGLKCAEEMVQLAEAYKVFMSSAENEGCDLDELDQMAKESYDKAEADCK